MSTEENKIKEEELQQQAEQEAEVVGTDADIEWNEETELDEQESKIAQVEAA